MIPPCLMVLLTYQQHVTGSGVIISIYNGQRGYSINIQCCFAVFMGDCHMMPLIFVEYVTCVRYL